MTERYVTHMMKERSKGVETAKCGVEVRVDKGTAPMTVWWKNVDCEGCKAAMNLQEAPVKLGLVDNRIGPNFGKPKHE